MDETLIHQEPEQLVLRDTSTALPVEGLEPARVRSKPVGRPSEQLRVILGLLGPRLRAYAQSRQTSMAAVVRRATWKMLDEQHVPDGSGMDAQPFEHSAHNVHFHLNLPAAYAAELTARARAADMTRGEFVWSLLKGLYPPPLAPDHAAAIQALRTSTDQMAAISTDLGAYLRLLSQANATREDLEPYLGSLRSLDRAVGEHLKLASGLLKDLKPYRRARW